MSADAQQRKRQQQQQQQQQQWRRQLHRCRAPYAAESHSTNKAEELVALKAVVSTQDGRGIAEIKRAHCFFEWLGVGRRATTKGLRRLSDLEDIESVGEADKLQFQQLLCATQNKFRERTATPRRARPSTASSPSRPAAAPTPAVSPLSRTRPDRSAVERGNMKSLVGMCRREQAGDDLRRAIRDSVNDANFDENTAPHDQLDFEVLVRNSDQPARAVFSSRGSPMTICMLRNDSNRDAPNHDWTSSSTAWRQQLVIQAVCYWSKFLTTVGSTTESQRDIQKLSVSRRCWKDYNALTANWTAWDSHAFEFCGFDRQQRLAK